MIALRARGLTRTFAGGRGVRGLDFEVERGEVFGFLGPNGAGKTTTVRLLTGQLRADSGRVEVLGLDPFTRPEDLRRRVGIVFEEAGHYERLPARSNLLFFARLQGAPPERVEALLREAGLADRARDPVSQLSRGMRRRLAMARALVGEPELLFLDEPTAGLDPYAAREVRRRIAGFAEAGGTVFLTTHYMDEAHELCGRVAILHEGKLVVVGNPDDLCAEHLPAEVETVRAGKTVRRTGNLEDLFFAMTGRTLDDPVERPLGGPPEARSPAGPCGSRRLEGE